MESAENNRNSERMKQESNAAGGAMFDVRCSMFDSKAGKTGSGRGNENKKPETENP